MLLFLYLFQNLSCNNLGPEGAKHLKNAIRSNCFLLKLNVSSRYSNCRPRITLLQIAKLHDESDIVFSNSYLHVSRLSSVTLYIHLLNNI